MNDSLSLRTTMMLGLVVLASAGCALKGPAKYESPTPAKRSARDVIADPFSPPEEQMDALIEVGWASEEDKRQREENEALYALHRDKIDALVKDGYTVAIANGEMFTATTYIAALEEARSAHPDHTISSWTKMNVVLRP